MNRRNFVQNTSLTTAGITLLGLSACSNKKGKTGISDESSTVISAETSLFFKISLAQWSVHSQIRAGKMKFIEFAQKTGEFGLGALEYVTQLFPDEKFDDVLLK